MGGNHKDGVRNWLGPQHGVMGAMESTGPEISARGSAGAEHGRKHSREINSIRDMFKALSQILKSIFTHHIPKSITVKFPSFEVRM